mgnify:CR=1 FL=1
MTGLARDEISKPSRTSTSSWTISKFATEFYGTSVLGFEQAVNAAVAPWIIRVWIWHRSPATRRS